MTGVGADPALTPEYPGISDQTSVADWDPPFPIDLSRVTPRDEAYWDRYRAAPKAFIPFVEAQRLWSSRFGRMTSLSAHGSARCFRCVPGDEVAREAACRTPGLAGGFIVQPVRQRALSAASARRIRSVLHLFQFLPRRCGAAPHGPLLPLGVEQRLQENRSAGSAGSDAARRPRALRARGIRPGARGQRARHRGRRRLRVAHHARVAYLVGGGSRDDSARRDADGGAAHRRCGGWPADGHARHHLGSWSGLARAGHEPAEGCPRRGAGGGAAPCAPALAGCSGGTLRGRGGGLRRPGRMGAIEKTAGFFGAGGSALVAALFFISWHLRRPPGQPATGVPWRNLARFGASNVPRGPGARCSRSRSSPSPRSSSWRSAPSGAATGRSDRIRRRAPVATRSWENRSHR